MVAATTVRVRHRHDGSRRFVNDKGDRSISVASVIEISASSSRNFEGALKEGIARTAGTVQNIDSAWV